MKLVALDVALLPPAPVADQAVALSKALPPRGPDRLRLGPEQLPHVTLTQQFVREPELAEALDRIDATLKRVRPLTLQVTGGGKGHSAVWMAIESSAPLIDLHHALMEALRGLERSGGGPAAFFAGNARPGDVMWVAGYRLKAAFASFQPHITLGHAATAPSIEPFAFTADTVAACHLGRFCTCRRVFRSWTLEPGPASTR
jgi:2'-5' RNA ligase